jgi:uncharacterized membrane protein
MNSSAHPIELGQLISKSWNQWKNNALMLTGLVVIMWVIQTVLLTVTGVNDRNDTTFELGIENFVSSLIFYIVYSISLLFFLKAARGEKVLPSTIKEVQWDRVGISIVVMIALGIVTTIGFFLLIVPGVWLMLTYAFTSYLIIDKGLNWKDALNKSAEMTRGKKLYLLLIMVVTGLIVLAGFFALIVGLLITIPVGYLMITNAYLAYQGGTSAQTHETAPASGPTPMPASPATETPQSTPPTTEATPSTSAGE